jgi:hypothetical protein
VQVTPDAPPPLVLCLSPTAPPCSDAPLRALGLPLRFSPATAPLVCSFSPQQPPSSVSGFPQPAVGFGAAVVFNLAPCSSLKSRPFFTDSSTGAESSVGHSSVRVLVGVSNLNQRLCYGSRASVIGFVYFRFHFSVLAVSSDQVSSRSFRASILVYSCVWIIAVPSPVPTADSFAIAVQFWPRQ